MLGFSCEAGWLRRARAHLRNKRLRRVTRILATQYGYRASHSCF
ncbi:hypothetical protein [Streptomyces acidiscabies]